METQLDITRLLALRKVTRSVAEQLGGQLRAHLQTLTPLVQPRNVLGEFVRGAGKQSVKGEEEAFQEVKNLYSSIAVASPYNLRKELETPLDVVSTTLELIPAEYSHKATTGSDTKTIVVATPLKWVLTYSGFGVKRMREFLAAQATSGGNDLYHGILHQIVLHVVFSKRPGLVKLLEAMRFSLSTLRVEGLGQLPFTLIESPVQTLRPSDEVVVQSTEISGTAAFEEVVNVDSITGLKDPLKEHLMPSIAPIVAAG